MTNAVNKASASLNTSPADPPVVVLLHGLFRRAGSMSRLEQRLQAAGFPTWKMTYRSRGRSIMAAAADVQTALLRAHPNRRFIAITHSLGGILVRHMSVPFLRILMLAPPNQGSALAARLRASSSFRLAFGPAGNELGADDGSAWPIPTVPITIVAGTKHRSIGNPTSWLSGRFLGAVPHDGTVAVSETSLPGHPAPILVHASHTWIMNHPTVIALALAFAAGSTDTPVDVSSS